MWMKIIMWMKKLIARLSYGSQIGISCKANLRAVDGASVVDVIAVTQAVTQMTGTYVRLN